MKRKTPTRSTSAQSKALTTEYDTILSEMVDLLETARRSSARAINAIMTATYWQIGRRIVEIEQRGRKRKDYYGEEIVDRLSTDLTARFGRGFGRRNLFQMKAFYLAFSDTEIVQTVSAQSRTGDLAKRFPLSWSHYVKLLAVRDEKARAFYEAEALRGGWSVRQLDRQIGTQFYQRTLLSRNKAAMLTKGVQAKPEDFVTPEEEIKDPFVLEFLDLKDEYSESELEAALIQHLEKFLLELGNDFTFVGRQRRLRIDDEWYRVDLLFYHRRLRCLIIIDLKLTKLTHADVGQMHLYCNYAKDHWTLPGENPPIGLILCVGKGPTLAKYALEGLPNKIMASEYLTTLPDVSVLEKKLLAVRRELETHNIIIKIKKPKPTAGPRTKGKKKRNK
jgi:predicted nuclease of restriction endonuclease-like (RecB) superfamily